jgi:hypothetical protein
VNQNRYFAVRQELLCCATEQVGSDPTEAMRRQHDEIAAVRIRAIKDGLIGPLIGSARRLLCRHESNLSHIERNAATLVQIRADQCAFDKQWLSLG